MARLIAFNSVSLDGYFVGAGGDIGWAHKGGEDAEWNAFVAGNAAGGGVLLFGRITYELMAGYWPTPLAAKTDPVVAQRMNGLRKVVFSRTMDRASWSNTTVVKGDLESQVRGMKKDSAEEMAILGSGSIVSQLAQTGLIDEFQVVVCPVALGKGRTLFEGVKGPLNLRLTRTRAFANGKVLLCYAPMSEADVGWVIERSGQLKGG